MRTIYKYPIKITDRQQIEFPVDVKFLHAGLDPQGVPCVWAEIGTDETETHPIVILVVGGTGNTIPEGSRNEYQHLGSFVQGPYMWHVYYRQ